MIYVDSSIALAYLFAEVRIPPPSVWKSPLVASRLLEYEVWTRLHARSGLTTLHFERAHELIGGVLLIELTREVLARALKPFPLPLRTLDALHLATVEYLRLGGADVELASYDARLLAAARALAIKTVEL